MLKNFNKCPKLIDYCKDILTKRRKNFLKERERDKKKKKWRGRGLPMYLQKNAKVDA